MGDEDWYRLVEEFKIINREGRGNEGYAGERRESMENEVKKGPRAFVVCGLAVGDVEGVRAFGRTVSSN